MRIKLTKEDFNKILKEYNNDYDMILRLYCLDKLYLDSYYLNEVLKKNREKRYTREDIPIRKKYKREGE